MISSGLLSAVSSRGQLLGLEIGLVCRVLWKSFRSKVLQEGSRLGRIRRGVKAYHAFGRQGDRDIELWTLLLVNQLSSARH